MESGGEAFWCRNYDFILRRGYIMRDKFRPGWKSARKNPKPYLLDPDEASNMKSIVCDANRASDGIPLMLKCIWKETQEVNVALYLNSLTSSDPRNYTIPILDIFDSHSDLGWEIMVMPRLHSFYNPPFDTVGELLDAFRQIFEGVHFMHKHFMAHRDLHWGNIMIDASKLYPNGHHPAITHRTVDGKHFAKYVTRTVCWPRHYIIDFGLTRLYDPSTIPFELHVPKPGAGIMLLPECRVQHPTKYNPFPADIYELGHTLDFKFRVHEHPPLQFLSPLVRAMMRDEPSSRPVISEVRRHFLDLCATLSKPQLRLPGCSETESFQAVRQLKHKVMLRDPLPSDFFAPTDLSFHESLRPFFTATPDPEIC